ncbi:MAG: antibiotic biosynthesis monooxygenase [Prolixibacteraceae bacterium]|jgi:quinol monooxygenase YgiN|nr:antibiotic biosynthesis monooxygenase [Prolixibacteraceae bacterium]
MKNIVLLATIKVEKGRDDLMQEFLRQLVYDSRKEKGCVQYDLHKDLDDPCCFLVYEIWKSQVSLDIHIDSTHFREFKDKTEDIMVSLEIKKLDLLYNS